MIVATSTFSRKLSNGVILAGDGGGQVAELPGAQDDLAARIGAELGRLTPLGPHVAAPPRG